MSYRSEANRIANKANYKELNLTQYPNAIDTRINNENMRGFTNVGEGQIPDYVMAEYVNAALDGLMAVERTLGTTPMVPHDTPPGNLNTVIEGQTVDGRLTRIEDGLFDERYGGEGWRFTPNRPTLSSHNHDGLNGHPSRIDLINEVTGLLRKQNINLTQNEGITGADLFVSPTNNWRIKEALDDALSKSAGGTVTGGTSFRGQFSSRTRMDFVAEELDGFSSGSLLSDSQATTGRAIQLSGTGAGELLNISSELRSSLLFGKYILSIRVKSTSAVGGSLLRFQLGTSQENVPGNEIDRNYKQIYFVFDQDETTKNQNIIIRKLATSNSVGLVIDSVFIEPIHPAVLDR